MNQQVDVDHHPLHRGQADQLGIAQKSGGTVVVGVEEGQGLLLEEQEDGIEQFEVFGQVVQLFCVSLVSRSVCPSVSERRTYIVENDQGLSPTTVVVTDGEENAMVPDGGDQLLDEQSQKRCADGGQVEVVDHEQQVQLEGLAVLHERATTEDDDIVGHQPDHRLLDG